MRALRPSLFAVLLACVGGAGCRGGNGAGGGSGGQPGGGGGAGTGQPGGASGGGGSDDGAIAFSRSELLGAFGSCAAAEAKQFRTQAVALDAAVAAYVASPDATSRDAARVA